MKKKTWDLDNNIFLLLDILWRSGLVNSSKQSLEHWEKTILKKRQNLRDLISMSVVKNSLQNWQNLAWRLQIKK